jgi:D-amino-acid oxidase
LTQSLKDQQVLFIKHRLSSLDEAYRLPLPAHLADELGTDLLEVDLVINATGLGAKGLLGVMDEEVYPIRGQTVLVKSDFAAVDGKRCYMGTRNMAKDADGESSLQDRWRRVQLRGIGDTGKAHEPCYIIPRPGPENHFILGGTYLADEWSPIPNLATSERMLKDCFKLNPDLAGPEREGRSWKDIEIVSHNVGLRPARRGGSRVELEERTLKVASEHDPLIPGIKEGGKEGGKKVAVVHAYGIGPAGYQASWGIAVKASGLADDWVSKRE